MNQTNRVRPRSGVLQALGLLCVLPFVVAAADNEFAGKWKGETKPQPTTATAATPTGAQAASAPSRGGGGGGGRGGLGGRGGFPGGGGFGGGGGGPQKVTINFKQSKDKLSGNITLGQGQPEDVKDGRISGKTITFKTSQSRTGQPPLVFEYLGELKGEELVLTRNSTDGRTPPQEIVLKKD